MAQEPEFTVTVDQNPYLTAGGTFAEAIVGITAAGAQTGPAGPAAQAAQVIIIDISGSMYGEKLIAAKNAARAALDVLRKGTYFALIAGDDRAELVYPSGRPRMVQITDRAREDAKQALRRLKCRGGTNFDPWLDLADNLLGTRPDDIRHAILLTDGHGSLSTALDRCRGHFTCDARGIGGDWSYQQLAKIADALLGTWGIIRDPEDMEADFREMTARAMSKTMAEVFLRVRPARGAQVRRIQQVAPAIVELTDKAVPADDGRSIDYPLGPWGSEARDYQLGIEVDQAVMAMETNNPRPARAALVSVVTHGPTDTTGTPDGGGSNTLAQASMKVGWTDDLGLSTRIDQVVARYTGQLELSQHVEAGLSALAKRDYPAAEQHLGTARRQAAQFGRDDTLVLLNRIVEVVDERAGTVRIRKGIDNKDVIEAAWSATQTVRIKSDQPQTPAPSKRESSG